MPEQTSSLLCSTVSCSDQGRDSSGSITICKQVLPKLWVSNAQNCHVWASPQSDKISTRPCCFTSTSLKSIHQGIHFLLPVLCHLGWFSQQLSSFLWWQGLSRRICCWTSAQHANLAQRSKRIEKSARMTCLTVPPTFLQPSQVHAWLKSTIFSFGNSRLPLLAPPLLLEGHLENLSHPAPDPTASLEFKDFTNSLLSWL